jgi:hypothetical protein
LRTGDVEVALDPRALERDAGIRERLAASGFREEFLGDDRPPVTHYALGDETSGFYVEFLTPLRGGERRRDGTRVQRNARVVRARFSAKMQKQAGF